MIRVSYANLGVRKDRDTGEIVPNLPRNNDPMRVLELESLWKNQVNLDPKAPKGTSGMIFPFSYPFFYPIEYFEAHDLESAGIVFLDVDHIPELKYRIMNHIEEINSKMGMCILAACTTHDGIHIICSTPPCTVKTHKIKVYEHLSFFAYTVNKTLGIDFRSIPNCLDSCTFSIKQRFFLRHSSEVYWNPLGEVRITLSDELQRTLKDEYPLLHTKAYPRYNTTLPSGLQSMTTTDVFGINPVESHPYIDHHERWVLFDSLCCLFNGESLKEQWDRCCDLMEEGHGHSHEFYKREPYKNKWAEIWNKSRQKYYNQELLESFGYVLGSPKYMLTGSNSDNFDVLMGLESK